MIGRVDSLADLTALRDREELEINVALMAIGALGACSAKLWRMVDDAGEARLHARVCVADRRVTVSDPPSDPSDLPRLDSRRELQQCHDRATPMLVSPDVNGGRRYVFPVTGRRGSIGFLEISSEMDPPGGKLCFIADLLRIYYNQLEILDYSENDELTGLANRKTFDSAFARMTRVEAPRCAQIVQFERVERRCAVGPDEPRWLAAMDVDFFKSVNDSFGHQQGDDVLVHLARLMRASFRAADRLFRSGGEEFVVILEPVEQSFVAGVLERFRAAVEAHDFPGVGRVTISVGYTRVGAADGGLAALRRADDALYAAKRQGRNRVISHDDLTAAGLSAVEAVVGREISAH